MHGQIIKYWHSKKFADMAYTLLTELLVAIRSISLFAALHIFSSRYLTNILRKMIEHGGFNFYPELSGRTSLYKLARIIKERNNKDLALVPDYICNVIYVALEKAGYEIRSYPTDELFEPLWAELENKIEDERLGIFLTASIFGSSAFLEELKQKQMRDFLIKRNIHVVVDLCQDINLVGSLPTDYEHNLSAVISFNDKSFPAAIGGGILTKIDVPESSEQMSINQVMKLYRISIAKIVSLLTDLTRMRRNKKPSVDKQPLSPNKDCLIKYDFSYCMSFPYQIEILKCAKVQIIMALIGFFNLASINNKKEKAAETMGSILKTKYYKTSPYFVITKLENGHLERKRKPSYATHKNPEESNRRELIIIHNKGFSDYTAIN